MKTIIVAVLAVAALSGCVAVPYGPGPGAYYEGPAYYGPAYYGPPVSFSFGYVYRDGGHRHYHGGRRYHR